MQPNQLLDHFLTTRTAMTAVPMSIVWLRPRLMPDKCKSFMLGTETSRAIMVRDYDMSSHVPAGLGGSARGQSLCCGWQAQVEILGKVKGQSVAMLVHHSRNSEQKQWDETLVLALSGMGRLLRAHLTIIAPMQAFPQVGPLSGCLPHCRAHHCL